MSAFIFWLFYCYVAVQTCYICHVVLNQLPYCALYILHIGVLKLVFFIQEGHLGTLKFVIQGFGTKEQTFSISKPTSQAKKQCFAVIATYFSSAEAIFVAESCSCRYDFNKLHFTFKCEGYT